jgi:molecular chaperone GrpE
MIAVQDDLERTMAAVPKDELRYHKHLSAVHDGVAMASRSLMQRMENFGIKRISAIGEKWDPQLHVAAFEVEDPATEPGVVCQVPFFVHLFSGFTASILPSSW